MIRIPATTVVTRLVLCAAHVMVTNTVKAQTSARSITLGPGTFKYEETFTNVSSVAVAADGSLYVADNKDKVVTRITREGSSRIVGRTGAGPGEYSRPGRVKIMRGDTLIVPDPSAGRLVFFTKDGKAAGTFSVADIPESPQLPQALLGAPGLLGADQNGLLYFGASISAPHVGASPIWRDSITVIRVDRAKKSVQVIARIQGAPKRVDIKSEGKTLQSVSINVNPLAAAEQATVTSSSQLIIARLDPFRMSFVSATGTTDGPIVRTETTRLGDAIKTAVLRRAAERSGITNTRPAASIVDWPTVVPPFMSTGMLLDTRGRIWLERPATNAAATIYDVIDGTGRLTLIVGVGASERVVGFTPTTVLTARVQEDGLQVIEVHPLP